MGFRDFSWPQSAQRDQRHLRLRTLSLRPLRPLRPRTTLHISVCSACSVVQIKNRCRICVPIYMGGIDARPPTNSNPTTQNDRQEKGTTNMKNPKLSKTACSGACAAARPTRMRRRSRNASRASTSSFAEPALPRRLSLAADKATPTAASRTAPLVRPPRSPPRPRGKPGRPQAGRGRMVLPRLPSGRPSKVPRQGLSQHSRSESHLQPGRAQVASRPRPS